MYRPCMKNSQNDNLNRYILRIFDFMVYISVHYILSTTNRIAKENKRVNLKIPLSCAHFRCVSNKALSFIQTVKMKKENASNNLFNK